MILFINNKNNNELHYGVIQKKDKIKEKTIFFQYNQGEELLKIIDKFLKKIKIKPNELEAIAVNVGPGSFTSLRLIMIMVNTWSYVHKISLYGFKKDKFSINNIITSIKIKKAKNFLEPHYGHAPQITKSKRKLW